MAAERLILALMAVCTAAVVRVTAGDCSRPPQLEHGSPSNEFTSETLFDVGTKITYSCYLGYEFKKRILNGSRSVTCREDSTWTPLRAICEPRSCGNPGELLNGYSEAPNATFGSKAIFHCNTGYQMVGRNFRLCKADGWDGQVPTCDVITCDDLPPITNGTAPSPPYGDYWEHGMVAKYSCNDDYSLIGAERLVCTATREWDNDPPMCKVVECHRPELPANGRIEAGFGPTYRYQETISYICEEDFEMVGKSVIECKEDNIFAPAPPTCKLVECIRPELPTNGRIEAGFGSTYRYLETISYICNEGFEMVGKSVIECKEDNTFVPGPPTCKLMNCGNPGEILNGYYEAPNTTFGSKAAFHCNTGYRMVGKDYQLCTADGWDGQVPTCEALPCHLPPINNGIAPSPPYGDHWEHGMVANYSCNSGYLLIGAERLVCTATGEWDNDPPTCNETKTPVMVREIGVTKQEPPPTNAQEKHGLGTTGIIVSCIIGICVGIGGAAGLSYYNKKRQHFICKKVHINPQPPNQSQVETSFEEYCDHPA